MSKSESDIGDTNNAWIDSVMAQVTPLLGSDSQAWYDFLTLEDASGSPRSWLELTGMREDAAEQYMRKEWGRVPDLWLIAQFRDIVTGCHGQAELDGHMNWGGLTYGDKSENPNEVAGVWYRRNIADQGHPAVEDGRWKPRKE